MVTCEEIQKDINLAKERHIKIAALLDKGSVEEAKKLLSVNDWLIKVIANKIKELQND